MVNSQTKEDKEHFFADLEKLCESESDSDQVSNTVSKGSRTTIQTNRNINTIPKVSSNDRHTPKNPSHRPPRAGSKASTPQPLKTSSNVIDLTSPTFKMPPVPSLQHSTASSPNLKRIISHKPLASSSKRVRISKDEVQLVAQANQIFRGLTFFFVPNNDIAKSRKVRILRAREHGAYWAKSFDETVTHVVVEQHISYSEARKAFPDCQIPDDAIVVKATWLSESLTSMCLKDADQSRFRLAGAPTTHTRRISPSKTPRSTLNLNYGLAKDMSPLLAPSAPAKGNASQEPADFQGIVAQVKTANRLPLELDYEELDSFSSSVSETSVETVSPKQMNEIARRQNTGFQCMESNTGANFDNPNSKTIAVLQEMATYYDRTGDHWRTTAYRKAISALRKQTKLISTREQALAIPQIGARLADKVEEIVATNRLRRLESTKDDPHATVLQLFMGVYDVGYKQASQWIAQGHRTLDDLLQKVTLSHNQHIGVLHYDDFLQRIPRAEVHQHGSIVRHACQSIDKDLQVIIGGSYRRGSSDSGDIDLIITKRDADLEHIRTLMTKYVIPTLKNSNFFKCTLASPQSTSSSSNTGSKWHGASCLPNSRVWRRIDLLFVPDSELGAALVYFTGNDIFNRSMRLLASKKGMRLNQHGLYKDVMRGQGRVKMTERTLVEGRSERRIFEILGVPWREPWERKC